MDKITKLTVYIGAATPALALTDDDHSRVKDCSFAIRVRSTAAPGLSAPFSRSPFFDANDISSSPATADYMLELSAPTVSDMKYWLRTFHTVLCYSVGLIVNTSLFYVQKVAPDLSANDRAMTRIRFGRADGARVRNVEERMARAHVERRMKYDRDRDEQSRQTSSPTAATHTRRRSLTVQTGNKTSAVLDLSEVMNGGDVPVNLTSLYPNSLQLALELPRAIHISHSTPILINMRCTSFHS